MRLLAGCGAIALGALGALGAAGPAGVGAAPIRSPERLAAATLTPVAVPVGPGATAVLTNIAMADATGPGFITADLCGALAPGPQSRANGNYDVGPAVANLSVVRVEVDGAFCVVNQSPVNIIVDAQGWFGPAAPGGLAFVPSDPRRVLDTRATEGARPGIGWITAVQTGAATGSSAVLANIAMVDAAGAGYITADRCSSLVAGPQSRANGSYGTSGVTANLTVVPIDPDGRFCIFNLTPVDLVVDVQGELRVPSAEGLAFSVSDPVRLLDTRSASATRPVAGSIVRVGTALPPGTRAALVNIAMVDAAAPGYVTADRCAALSPGPQPRANGNHRAGGAVANLSVVALDADGAFCIYNQSAVHLVVDLQGSFGAAGSQLFFPIDPVRVLDTRPLGGEPLPAPGPATTVAATVTTSSPTRPLPPPGGPRTSCKAVVHIGDSTSVGMISSSLIPDPQRRLDAQYRRVGVLDPRMEISGARSIVEVLRGQVNARDAAARQRASGFSGCWVFALGTTDTANLALAPTGLSRRERIDRMMAVAAGDPVLWVDTRTILTRGEWSNPWMQLWNQELAAAKSRHPNLRIYNWSSVAQTQWFSSDGVHYTPEGYASRAMLIANALAEYFPG